ncbi:hypothetical protein Y017_08435 [Alcanivorax sp. 97CO-5]|nr:hypothetical protein Y017_08435 [Alcanivorax sp. 97CO-5]
MQWAWREGGGAEALLCYITKGAGIIGAEPGDCK